MNASQNRFIKDKPKIDILPVIDSQRRGVYRGATTGCPQYLKRAHQPALANHMVCAPSDRLSLHSGCLSFYILLGNKPCGCQL